MQHDASFRVRMSRLSDGEYRYHLPAKYDFVTPQSAPWALLHLWIDQVQQHESLDRMSAVHLPFEQPQEFARMLRQLDWRVYHYRTPMQDQDARRFDPGHTTEWGYIVGAYCEQFMIWRLTHV